MTELLTAQQAAELLGCEASTIQARLVEHELPGVKFGREWRIPREALLAHLNQLASQHLQKPVKPPRYTHTPKSSRQPPKLMGL